MASSICETLEETPESAMITWKASGRGGAVAAGGSGAVAAGIQLLEERGNAADAAVATLLALTVTDYPSFSFGGEVPLIIYDANKQEVKVLGGAGRAPLDQDAIDWYYANNIPDSPYTFKAMPVPAPVHLCSTALELYGTKSFEEVVTPTLALLDAGETWWHPKLAVTLRKMVEREQQTIGTREQKLRAARDRFYKGDIADDLVAWYRDVGSFLRKQDLENHVTTVEDSVSVNYRGYVVHKCNTWTQGPVLCQTLRLLESYNLQNMGHLSADYIHVLTEAMKLAYADRDTYYGDPAFVDVPLTQLLSDQYTNIRRSLIDMANASMDQRPGDPYNMQPLKSKSASTVIPGQQPETSDTTTAVVADRWGNVVASTPSGGGHEPGPVVGIGGGNRLVSLNTTPGHPNRMQPGKLPRITLTPTLVTKDGKPIIAISVGGGDLQDQTALNVLLNHIEFGMMPEQAVTEPRFNTDHMEGSFNPDPDRNRAFQSNRYGPGSLTVHVDVASSVQDELRNRGHSLSRSSGAIGAPVMIYIDQDTGIIHAAGDASVGKHAAALAKS